MKVWISSYLSEAAGCFDEGAESNAARRVAPPVPQYAAHSIRKEPKDRLIEYQPPGTEP